ncbi:basic amino acid/polyamine antiporter [Nocardiopsis sp. NPDC050513]|uniref:basic amino acid/polyamine antiporter n=1 Tax=Nocardiopsis sp. NPDC050513 TaxID=3364338 RepID=UPI003797C915
MTERRNSARSTEKVGLLSLMALVVGSMVGAGVFSLPQRFAQEAGVLGALVAWAVAGAGMLTLALVFQSLALRRPDLDAGVYAYARAGFGEFAGFLSAVGYWAGACVGNVTYWILITSTLGAVFPGLLAGGGFVAALVSTVGLWCFYHLVKRGVREANAVNRVVTIAKVVPILVFVLLAAYLLDPEVFAQNLTGADYTGSLFEQVRETMLITVFVFLGVEGASVYSRHARRRSDVGRATVLGFLSVSAVFASVTIVSYGILPMSQIAELPQPSMAGVLASAVGPWGGAMVGVGLLVSVLGAYLAWTLMAAEVLFVAAEDRDMPRFLAVTDDRDVPVNALLLTTLLTQAVLVVTLFSANAFDFALNLTAALSLFPYLLTAAYAVRLAATRETYADDLPSTRRRELAIALAATVYTVFLVYAAGIGLVLLGCVFYVPATLLFARTRRERGERVFSARELVLFTAVVIGAAVGLAGLGAGWITL